MFLWSQILITGHFNTNVFVYVILLSLVLNGFLDISTQYPRLTTSLKLVLLVGIFWLVVLTYTETTRVLDDNLRAKFLVAASLTCAILLPVQA